MSDDTKPLTRDELIKTENRRLSEVSHAKAQSIAAWLLATLVAVNTSGAGAVLALDANHDAAIAFASGVFLAILSGMASWGEATVGAVVLFMLSVPELNRFDLQRLDRHAFWSRILFRTAFAIGCAKAAGG